MKFIIDLSFLLDFLLFIAKNVDFNQIFGIIFCFIAFLTVTKITLNMLADKPIKFSWGLTISYVAVGGVMFAVSYTELCFVSVVFTNIAQVLFYSISECIALIALYACFLLFASRANGREKEVVTREEFLPQKNFFAKVEEFPIANTDKPVLKLKTKSVNGSKTKVVDIEGVLNFIDNQIELGNTALKPIRNKVAFYLGAELKDSDVVELNELFSKAVKL